MGKKVVKKIELTEDEIKARLDPLMRDLASKKHTLEETKKKYDELAKDAFPLVEALGDSYLFEGIKARITRPKTWKVDVVKLLKKFGEKVYHMLSVSVTVFQEDLERGVLGTQDELKAEGIAVKVDQTPRFTVELPKTKTRKARKT